MSPVPVLDPIPTSIPNGRQTRPGIAEVINFLSVAVAIAIAAVKPLTTVYFGALLFALASVIALNRRMTRPQYILYALTIGLAIIAGGIGEIKIVLLKVGWDLTGLAIWLTAMSMLIRELRSHTVDGQLRLWAEALPCLWLAVAAISIDPAFGTSERLPGDSLHPAVPLIFAAGVVCMVSLVRLRFAHPRDLLASISPVAELAAVLAIGIAKVLGAEGAVTVIPGAIVFAAWLTFRRVASPCCERLLRRLRESNRDPSPPRPGDGPVGHDPTRD